MLQPSTILPKTESTLASLLAVPHVPRPRSLPPLFEAWLRAGSTGSCPPHATLGVCLTRGRRCTSPPTPPGLRQSSALCAGLGMMVWDGHSHGFRGLCKGLDPYLPLSLSSPGGGVYTGVGGLCQMQPWSYTILLLPEKWFGLQTNPSLLHPRASNERPGIGNKHRNGYASHPLRAGVSSGERASHGR